MKKNIKELLPYVIIIGVVILIRTFIITPVIVSGDSMKLLSINGTAPTYDNIKTGLYNIQTAYYAVIRKDEPKDSNARKLLNAMKSERGQNVAKEAGYVQNY